MKMLYPTKYFNPSLFQENPIPEEIIEMLAFSRNKLIDKGIAWQLRATSYLRIGCTALRKYNRLVDEHILPGEYDLSYLQILELLLEYDVDWWRKCHISSIGTLESHDKKISEILHFLNDFYECAYQRENF